MTHPLIAALGRDAGLRPVSFVRSSTEESADNAKSIYHRARPRMARARLHRFHSGKDHLAVARDHSLPWLALKLASSTLPT
jgi:hypothetical protein